MSKGHRNINAVGFGVMCTAFSAIGLLNVNFMIRAVGAATADVRSPKGLFFASVVMTALAAFAIRAQIWYRRSLVKEFTYGDRVLRFSTLGAPAAQTRDLSEIAEIKDWRGRGGPQGYRLRFRDGAKVYLHFGVSNSMAAVNQMRQDSQAIPL